MAVGIDVFLAWYEGLVLYMTNLFQCILAICTYTYTPGRTLSLFIVFIRYTSSAVVALSQFLQNTKFLPDHRSPLQCLSQTTGKTCLNRPYCNCWLLALVRPLVLAFNSGSNPDSDSDSDSDSEPELRSVGKSTALDPIHAEQEALLPSSS